MGYKHLIQILLITAFIWAVACGAVQSLSPAETLLNRKCGACHPSPRGKKFSEDTAVQILERHARRVPLTPEERRSVLMELSDTPRDAADDPNDTLEP